MRRYPLVSILIPVYNQRPEFLRPCIESAINQCYPNLEVIISDNFSTDQDLHELISEFNDHTLVRIVRPPTHVTMIKNFAFVASCAKGEFISFLSSDDMLEKDCISSLMDLMQQDAGIDFAFGDIECIDAFSGIHRDIHRKLMFAEGIYDTKRFLDFFVRLDYCVWMNGDLIRKEAYDKIGGIEYAPVMYSYDHALALRLLSQKAKVGYLNRVMGKVRIWSDQSSKVVKLGLFEEINDIIAAYDIVLSNPYLLRLAEGGTAKVTALRNTHLIAKSEYAAICYLKGTIGKEKLDIIRRLVLSKTSNLKVRLYFLACRQPMRFFLQFLIQLKAKRS